MNEEPVVGEGKRGRGVGEGGEEGGGRKHQMVGKVIIMAGFLL